MGANLVLSALLLATGSFALPSHSLHERTINATVISACSSLGKAGISTYSGLSLNSLQDASHWMISSSQVPTCIVKPTTPQQLSTIMQTIAAQRIPFAVESGGHASNQGFSSTTGIHITLNGFSNMQLSADQSTFTYGPGHVWDDIYSYLQSQTGGSKLVVGGRVPGVGVGGFAVAGGGYSWLSQSQSLTVDNFLEMDVVMPNGTITTCSNSVNPDLFWALRGAGNDFGIVTSFTVKTVPVSPTVYGGLQVYGPEAVDKLAAATVNFSMTNTDPNGNVLPTFNAIAGVPGVEFLRWYNGSSPGSFFDAFDKAGVTPITNDVKARTFSSMVQSAPSQLTGGQRGAFHTISLVENSQNVMNAIVSELKKYAAISLLHSATLISYDVEPFVKTYYSNSQDTPFPHSPSRPLLPLNLYFAWTNPLEDDFWHGEMKKSVDYITSVARNEGQAIDPVLRYPNYALADTSLQELYGSDNLARLSAIKKQIDPTRIMDLTGGFKIPF